MSDAPAAEGVWYTPELLFHADRECDAIHDQPETAFVACEMWDALDLRTAEWMRVWVEYCRLCANRLPVWGAAVEAVPWQRRRLVQIPREEPRVVGAGAGEERL